MLFPLKKDTGTIVINLKQLRATNRVFIQRKGGPKEYFMYDARDHLNVKADVFIKMANDHYIKLLEFSNNYKLKYYDETIATILNELITAAVAGFNNKNNEAYKKNKFLKDTSIFKFTNTEVVETLSSIKATLSKDWRNYPIMKNLVTADCIYKSFDDFRSDTRTIAGSIKQITINDSLYDFSFKYPDSSNLLLSPYAVVKDGITYVWLMYKTYVRLDKRDDGFHFQVPSSLLNLYEICTIELIYSKRPPTLIPIVGLEGELAINAVDQIIKDKKRLKILKNQNENNYRSAVIDLYNGDFLY